MPLHSKVTLSLINFQNCTVQYGYKSAVSSLAGGLTSDGSSNAFNSELFEQINIIKEQLTIDSYVYLEVERILMPSSLARDADSPL